MIGIFEGKYHTYCSNQSETYPIIGLRIGFDEILQRWETRNGKIRAPAGCYCFESRITIDENCPGTLITKNGTIEYAIIVKLKTSGRIGHSENVKMKPVFVVPVVDISWYTSFRAPVFVQKNYKKKFLCCNKINATLCIELEKAAFITGEKINVYGEIDNQHNSKPIKEGLVELVSVFRCRCKGAQKYSLILVIFKLENFTVQIAL
ncbi:unnamed protein product [Dracunculus medinensis]|uniref:Arrestin_N domain-containing protein n=1 Tax=Dracunculus medinensis TaxID=318479 RepID=A0A3P7PL61_DRAME|nr:unnamed protein product [Dracunculus medinensis]